MGAVLLCSCGKKESGEASKPAPETTAPAQPATGPHAVVHLKDGSKTLGAIVASSQTDMVVAGDDGIERKIPLAQIGSVEYGDAQPAQSARREVREPAPDRQEPSRQATPEPAPPPPPPPVTSKTYKLPAGSEISVRTNEAIDSGTAVEGQSFDAQVTRDAKDAGGDVVVPRGSRVRIVIKSASKGGRFRGAADLVLDLQSVSIEGRHHAIDAADIGQKGNSGVGVNKRTGEFAGGGAAIGAIIGAIAGGGKGAAIGGGAGAGAGVLTQVLTKGGSIKVPAESVLTFSLDRPLRVTLQQ
jgi:hypothetical protein